MISLVTMTENGQFHSFIMITMILTARHDSAIGGRRFFGSTSGGGVPLFDDLRALVEFARAGSIAGAADRLYRTPSAITRQLQRLEAQLGAELLDRSVKPPRLNSARLQGARTSARSVAADGGAEICYVERR